MLMLLNYTHADVEVSGHQSWAIRDFNQIESKWHRNLQRNESAVATLVVDGNDGYTRMVWSIPITE